MVPIVCPPKSRNRHDDTPTLHKEKPDGISSNGVSPVSVGQGSRRGPPGSEAQRHPGGRDPGASRPGFCPTAPLGRGPLLGPLTRLVGLLPCWLPLAIWACDTAARS